MLQKRKGKFNFPYQKHDLLFNKKHLYQRPLNILNLQQISYNLCILRLL